MRLTPVRQCSQPARTWRMSLAHAVTRFDNGTESDTTAAPLAFSYVRIWTPPHPTGTRRMIGGVCQSGEEESIPLLFDETAKQRRQPLGRQLERSRDYAARHGLCLQGGVVLKTLVCAVIIQRQTFLHRTCLT